MKKIILYGLILIALQTATAQKNLIADESYLDSSFGSFKIKLDILLNILPLIQFGANFQLLK